ncbi:MAG: 4-hydroxy-tetrahydrodipicolinate reductase, partial [Clostridiales bacterium]
MKVAMIGVNGKMGRAILAGIIDSANVKIVGAVDIVGVGVDISALIGGEPRNIIVENSMEKMIKDKEPDVIIDFTSPKTVKNNVKIALANKVHIIVGTTGLSTDDLEEINSLAKEVSRVAFVVPNFALGAVLMMNFSAQAAKYFPNVEVIELHHDQKLDAPSGTAIKTLEMMAAEREKIHQGNPQEVEKIKGARGGEYQGMRVHSVRLPGYVAHQEVLFGGRGQTLSIRHDSMNRDSFVDGVLLTLNSIGDLQPGLTYG